MTATATRTRYQVIGSTKKFTTCEHCGRTDLKQTVILEELDGSGYGSGETIRMGTSCAATAMLISEAKVTKAVKKATAVERREAQEASQFIDNAARKIYRAEYREATDEELEAIKAEARKIWPRVEI